MATDEASKPGAISPATPEPTEPDAPTSTTEANKGGAKHWIARPTLKPNETVLQIPSPVVTAANDKSCVWAAMATSAGVERVMVCCRGAWTRRLGASSALLRPKSASSRKQRILSIAGIRGLNAELVSGPVCNFEGV